MIISVNAIKEFDKIQHPFRKLRIRGELPQLDKQHPQRPIADTVLKGKKAVCFPPRIRNKLSMSTFIPLIQPSAGRSSQCHSNRRQ